MDDEPFYVPMKNGGNYYNMVVQHSLTMFEAMTVGISRDLITIESESTPETQRCWSVHDMSFILHMLHYAAFHPVERGSQLVHTIRGFDWGDASNQKKIVHTTSHSKPQLKTLPVLFPIDS